MTIDGFVRSSEKRKKMICRALTENPDHPDKNHLNKELKILNEKIFKAKRRGIGDESV